MHGQNSKENQTKLVAYYNEYVARQKNVGVNLRHKSIASRLVDAGLIDGSNLLEIGCGIGTFSSLLPEINGSGKNLCVDISDESIKAANTAYGQESALEFLCANAVEHDFKNQKFDVIVLPDVIEHIPLELHAELFEKLASILTPNGFIFIHIPNPYYLEWCHKNRPDLLQIIDQPIYTNELVSNLSKSNLYIHTLESYAIWIKDCDYQAIVLRKEGWANFETQIEEKVTFWDKLKYKWNARKQ